MSPTVSDADVESHNRLLAASVTSLMSGSYGGWRMYRKELAKNTFSRVRDKRLDDGKVSEVIDTLRMCNSPKEVEAVAFNLWMTGPVGDLRTATVTASNAELTRHSFESSVRLFRQAGDLLPSDVCARLVFELCEVLRGNSKNLSALLDRSLTLQQEVIKTISILVVGCREEANDLALTCMLELSGSMHEVATEQWSRLINNLSNELLQKRLFEIEDWVKAHAGSNVAVALNLKLIDNSEICRAGVLDLTTSYAFMAVNVLHSERIPATAATAFIDHWMGRHERRIADCTEQGFGFGGPEPSEILTLAFIKRPELARWDAILQFLRDPAVYGFMKRRPLELISTNIETLPLKLQTQLCAILDAGIPCRDYHWEFKSSETLAGMPEVCRARLLLPGAAIVRKQIERLALGTKQERTDCVDLIDVSRADSGFVLKYLSRDPDSTVRHSAQQAWTYRVATGGSKAEFQEVVTELLDERNGISQSLRLARRLVDTQGHEVSANRLAELKAVLLTSKSSRVRALLLEL